MTKGYLLGPNAANYVAARMKEQGAKTGTPAAYSARISGQMMPFEITSEWEKRDEESVYSCKANQIYFDGKTYVKDEEGFEFTLYSPLDLEEEPGYAVGDLVYAIIRGNNWEIVGSPGEVASIKFFILREDLNNTNRLTTGANAHIIPQNGTVPGNFPPYEKVFSRVINQNTSITTGIKVSAIFLDGRWEFLTEYC